MKTRWIYIFNSDLNTCREQFWDLEQGYRVVFDDINTLEDCYRYGGASITSVIWAGQPADERCIQWFKSRRRKAREGEMYES